MSSAGREWDVDDLDVHERVEKWERENVLKRNASLGEFSLYVDANGGRDLWDVDEIQFWK